MHALPLLALENWGLAFGISLVLLMFLGVGYVIVQGTRIQLYWRRRVEEGDVEAIRALVNEELGRWKTARTPKGVEPAVWHGVQSAELVDVAPDGVRISAAAEGQYAVSGSERRETSGALREGMKLTAKLADMVLWDIPNVRIAWTQVDVYSTFRDEGGASQRAILTTTLDRERATSLDWDDMDAEDIVRAFDGRFALDDRGNPLPITIDEPRTAVPQAFYEE
jgi:hypothetical protein